MNSNRTLSAFAALLFIVLASTAFAWTSLAPQSRDKIPEHKFERETVIDENGLQQWAPFEVECFQCKKVRETKCFLCGDREALHCIECGGDKKATCRICIGTAHLLDPVVEIPCPYCQGAGVYPCAQCWGIGVFPVGQEDGSSRNEKCRGCKEEGGFECTPCGGTRKLAALKIKKKPIAEAKLKDLKRVREDLIAFLAKNEAFEHGKNPRKTEKAYVTLIKKPAKSFPVLKDVSSLLVQVHKGFSKSASEYQGYDDKIARQFYIFQDRTTWLLRHQILLLEKEIARAEFNAAVLAEEK